MAILQSQIPASLRNLPPTSSRRTGPENLADVTRPYLMAARKVRSPAIGSKAFIALPMESEDARITGATRSLDRRLLALNLYGSRMPVKSHREPAAVDSRIA
jgi:hypothetical protein